MQVIRLIGITHDDPLCRLALTRDIADLQRQHGVPSFAAVECDFTFFNELRNRRPEFRGVLRTVFSGGAGAVIPADGFLDAIVNTLGYEPEVIRAGIDPGIVVHALDHDRVGHSGDRIAHRTWFTLRALLDPRADPQNPWSANLTNTNAALAGLSTALHVFANRADPNGFHRDELWANRLIEWAPPEAVGWVLVVVGALHATYYRREATLRRLLEDAGRPVEAVFPCFQPPADWGL
jgi:hypothetical protein